MLWGRFMKNKAGFLLSASIVYVTLLIMFTATAIRLSMLIIPHAYCLIEWNTHTDFYVACDQLYKSFCCAPAQASQWYKADKDGFIWHADEKDYGWLIIENKLVYKEGTYNSATQSWASISTSLIAPQIKIERVDFLVKDGKVHEVTCLVYKGNDLQHSWSCGKVF
jgi:hypothetical protein